MQGQIHQFIAHVKESAANPAFVHHKWFVKYHLQIVEKIAFELCDIYKDADRDFVQLLVWLHDYGKILDFDNQYDTTLSAGRKKLGELGFDSDLIKRVIDAVATIDRKDWDELQNASIEVKIVSSADAASHHTGPFFVLWWYENADKDFTELMNDNIDKSDKDWHRKMVLPEVRRSFEMRRKFILELNGQLPDRFIV